MEQQDLCPRPDSVFSICSSVHGLVILAAYRDGFYTSCNLNACKKFRPDHVKEIFDFG